MATGGGAMTPSWRGLGHDRSIIKVFRRFARPARRSMALAETRIQADAATIQDVQTLNQSKLA
jgi:hypothetical protein